MCSCSLAPVLSEHAYPTERAQTAETIFNIRSGHESYLERAASNLMNVSLLGSSPDRGLRPGRSHGLALASKSPSSVQQHPEKSLVFSSRVKGCDRTISCGVLAIKKLPDSMHTSLEHAPRARLARESLDSCQTQAQHRHMVPSREYLILGGGKYGKPQSIVLGKLNRRPELKPQTAQLFHLLEISRTSSLYNPCNYHTYAESLLTPQ